MKQRRYTRFKPQQSTLATITGKEWEHALFALVLSESYGGCGLAITTNAKLEVGNIVYAEVGKIGPLESEIVWIQEVDKDIQKLGIKFLE